MNGRLLREFSFLLLVPSVDLILITLLTVRFALSYSSLPVSFLVGSLIVHVPHEVPVESSDVLVFPVVGIMDLEILGDTTTVP